MRRRWTAAVVVAAAVSIATPSVHAAAEVRIGINGARPSTWSFLSSALDSQGLTQDAWLSFASRVGENWLPGTTPVPLVYPAQIGPISGPNALSTDESTTIGQQNLDALIREELNSGQPIAVAGGSEGTLVIDQEEVYLQTDPNAPPAQDITFYVFGDMARGLGNTYFSGTTVPFFGKTFGPLPDSQYNTVVVNEEWDGWANPPDRPWDLLADINAVMGAVLPPNNDHSQTTLDSMSDAVEVSQTTSSLGGTTTTYLVPREQLPITKPLLEIGVPQSIVDQVDNLLRPFIEAGYSSMTPYLGPHVDQGQLVWTTPQTETTPAVPQSGLTSVKTEAAGTDSTLNAASAATSEVVTPTHQRVAINQNSGVSGSSGAKSVGAVEASGSVANVPEFGFARRARPAGVDESGGSVDAGQHDGHRGVAADTSGLSKDGPESGAALRPRPARGHEDADSDGSADGHVPKPTGTGQARASSRPTTSPN